jgi:uncharacterized protein (DUF2236 family)
LLLEEFLANRAREALELFRELDQSEREPILAAYLEASNDIVREQFRRGGIDAPLVKASFARHFAKEKWGDPSPEEILSFANRRLAEGG